MGFLTLMLLFPLLSKHVLGVDLFLRISDANHVSTPPGARWGRREPEGRGSHRKPHQETEWLSQLIHRLGAALARSSVSALPRHQGCGDPGQRTHRVSQCSSLNPFLANRTREAGGVALAGIPGE